MGQAKLKGSFEERRAKSIADARVQFPDTVTCNNCGHSLSEITNLDVRGMPGMRLAGAAICPECTQTTWITDGTPQALAELQEYLNAEHGQEGKMGVAFKTN